MRSLLGSIVNRSPVPLSATRRGGGIFSFSRGLKPLDAYGQVGTLFQIVNSYAVATSAVEWKLFQKAKSGLKEDRTEITEHEALTLWNRPNPFMPGQEFRERGQQHIELVGEACLIVSTVRIAGQDVPIEMWPVRPDRITPVPDPYEFIKGYVYTSPDGDKIPLEVHEVKQIMMPNPSDPYRGLGPVQSILTDLDSSKYSAEWNRNFFENSAEPGGVIEVDHKMGDEEFEEMRERWSASHRGVSKAHRIAILEAGAKYVARGFTQRDMQFAELRTVSRDVIMEAFGYPKHMAGISTDVNRANAEAAEYMFSKWRIVDRLDRWKAMLNFELLPMYGRRGEGLEFDYESPVSENSDARNAAVTANSTALATLTEKGFDAAEVCDWLGIPQLAYEKPEPKVVQVPANPNDPNADPGQGDNGDGA